MKTETEKELRELDVFCAEKVMGWKLALRFDGDELIQRKQRELKKGLPQWLSDFRPTTNPADAMAVLEKCFERMGGTLIGVAKIGSVHCVCVPAFAQDFGNVTSAETLPLAICKFAKQLFSK